MDRKSNLLVVGTVRTKIMLQILLNMTTKYDDRFLSEVGALNKVKQIFTIEQIYQ